jgi:hypothetical protein
MRHLRAYESDGGRLFRELTQGEIDRMLIRLQMNHLPLSDTPSPARWRYVTAQARMWMSHIERETVFRFLVVLQDKNGIIESVSARHVELLLGMLRKMKFKFYLKSAFVRPEGIVVCPDRDFPAGVDRAAVADTRENYLRCSLKDSAGDHKTLTILPLGDVEVAGLILGFEGDGLGLKGLPEVKMYFIADDYVLLEFLFNGLMFRCDGMEGVVECLESVLSAPGV